MISYNLILSLFILLLKSFQLWPFRSLIRLYLLTCPITFQSFFFFEHFLFIFSLSYIFLVPTLESTFSPRSTSFFYWRMDLEILVVVGMLVASGASLLLGPLGEQEIFVWIRTYTHIYIYFSMYLSKY